ncbi:hypothetical protein MKW94_030099 [Papaver nudicaule]|uniref:DUF7880 domain-containing protein n=1 Tax=Papaver nudicaule TaxID=74823 RepID=A0AA41VZN3_PAPNU|nr:hypothetical protein [Papaver nudicaule]
MATIFTQIIRFSSTNPDFNKKRSKPCLVKCAVNQPSVNNIQSSSRRSISIAAVLLFQYLSVPNYAIADGGLDKYLKRKKLDPLEVYVPAVILSKSQFRDLEKTLEAEKPQYAACRSLLRSGPAASLRVNIRAVAQYASDDGKGKAALDDVDQCLRALEDLDSLFLRASRNDRGASTESMKKKIGIALVALDR